MRRERKSGSSRTMIAVAFLALLLKKASYLYLLPFGPAEKLAPEHRPVYAEIDHGNDSLQAKNKKLQKIFERVEDGQDAVLKGPETVVFGNDGTMYVLTEEANLVSLTDFRYEKDGVTVTAKATIAADLGMGRPLGGKFTTAVDDTLYVADALLGLTRIKDPQHDPRSKVELVASTVRDNNGASTRILFADDVAIGPKTGKVYFSDASDIPPDKLVVGEEEENDETWDVLYASKLDLMRAKRTGRLLQYDPSTDEVTVLARDLWFANGVAVDRDETCVVFVETFDTKLNRYHLTGPQKGTIEVLVDAAETPGMFDGTDCDWSSNKCYAAIVTAVPPVLTLLNTMPHPLDAVLRTVLMTLPRWMSPKPTHYGGILEVDLRSSSSSNNNKKTTRIIQDPTGLDIGSITGVTVHENKLYLGSLTNNFVGVYSLP